MQVKYISDLHLYDISSLDWRKDIDNLDKYATNLIDGWNEFTEPNEIVILVGDIGTYCTRTLEVLKRLHGIKILVTGNHDLAWGSNIYTCGIFSGVHTSIDRNNVFIQHIPDAYSGTCQFFVHGHHHRYDMPGMQKALQLYARDTYRLNCAADLNNNRPCTLQELMLNKELLLESSRENGLLTGGL